jgi:hypothetical protein
LATGIDLVTIAHVHRIPYGTLVRWAHEQQWPVVRELNRRLGQRKLYDGEAVQRAINAREQRQAA